MNATLTRICLLLRYGKGWGEIMAEHKVIGGPIWFTLHGGECIGILVMNNGFEDKAYIGKGQGFDEEADIRHILQRGAKFPLKEAKSMCGIE